MKSFSLAIAEEFIAQGQAHMANYREVVDFDPVDAFHEYMFARESLRIAKEHFARAEYQHQVESRTQKTLALFGPAVTRQEGGAS